MQKRRRALDNDGFTLLELLAATVLLGIVAASTYACFISGLYLHRRASDLQQLEHTVRKVSVMLANDLGNLVSVASIEVPEDSLSLTFLTYAIRPGTPEQPYSCRTQAIYYFGKEDKAPSRVMKINRWDDDASDSSVFRLPEGYEMVFTAEGVPPSESEHVDTGTGADERENPFAICLRVVKSLAGTDEDGLIYERIYRVW